MGPFLKSVDLGVTRKPTEATIVGRGGKDLARGEFSLGEFPTGNPQDRPYPLGSDYERFNCSNFDIHHWSWNYRGCWHQTCPPIVARPST